MLLAELFSDVIAGELACRLVRGAGADGDVETYRQTTRNIIRRYAPTFMLLRIEQSPAVEPSEVRRVTLPVVTLPPGGGVPHATAPLATRQRGEMARMDGVKTLGSADREGCTRLGRRCVTRPRDGRPSSDRWQESLEWRI